MVTPPKCKVCGVAHWSGEGHSFGKPAADPPALNKATAAAVRLAKDVIAHKEMRDAMQDAFKATIVAEPGLTFAGPGDIERGPLSPPKRDRAAYMRAYRAKTNHPG